MIRDTKTTELKIGDVARLTGLLVRTIRYYEQRGLLEPAARSESGYRLYGAEDAARLEFIKRAKLLGLTLEEIRELVELATRCNEGEIVPRLEEVLEAKLEETERKMAELSVFRQNLLYYRERAEDLKDHLSTDRYCEDVSFCGCLEAVTEGGEKPVNIVAPKITHSSRQFALSFAPSGLCQPPRRQSRIYPSSLASSR
jgi:DNA-binding transcriptional MerR regulator